MQEDAGAGPGADWPLIVVAIARNEAPYLREWLAWVLFQGAEAVILYDNDSTDGTGDLARSLQRFTPLTVIPWAIPPRGSVQMSAYRDAVFRLRGLFGPQEAWVAMIDLDEFILPVDPALSLRGCLARLACDPDVGAMALSQQPYGPSGRTVRSRLPVMQRFVRHGDDSLPESRWIKSIYRLSAIGILDSPHGNPLLSGRYVHPDGGTVRFTHLHDASARIDRSVLQLNHYVIKTWPEYLAKRARGSVAAKSAAARNARYTIGFFRNRAEALDRLPCPHAPQAIRDSRATLCAFDRIETEALGPGAARADLPPGPLLPLTLVAIARNEARYLEDWLIHHRMAGVDRVILYDNDSTDRSAAVLEGMVQIMDLTVIPWPTVEGVSPQLSAYADAMERLRDEGQDGWAAFIDIDEMLVATGPESLPEVLADLVQGPVPGRDGRVTGIGAVVVNQRPFGDSGLMQDDGRPDFARLTRCAGADDPDCEWVKAIYRIGAVDRINGPHFGRLAWGHVVHPDGEKAGFGPRRGRATRTDQSRLQLNHYITRTWPEFLAKRVRGGGLGKTLADRQRRYAEDAFFLRRQHRANRMACPFSAALLAQLLRGRALVAAGLPLVPDRLPGRTGRAEDAEGGAE